ncbi:tetratricopeptide repeat protein [Thiohalocapsa sp. ML1]|uniref:tetratricopeptide repeat protein n=1 Tax=Thiohalocapsa sp. ML1 TaxID=1431688 RepID=UPI000AB021D8|nr:tetratricopeptide repeat protein [Thiohalocapsa sp. ML1]
MARLYGREHQQLIDWLAQEWWPKGPPICVIEGFPGVGKTRIAEELMVRLDSAAVLKPLVECPAASVGLEDDLLLNLAETLADQGDHRLADSLSLPTLKAILARPVLLVIDELQRGFVPGSGKPSPELARVLKELGGSRGAGRVLLLSSRELERERANERWAVHRLHGLPADEAVELFDHLLAAEGIDGEFPHARKHDIATWLGGYPRALRLFANRLRYEPLDDLLGFAHETWEAKDRKVSAELLTRIESEMFQRAREGLDAAGERFLRRLAVFRNPVEPQALERLIDAGDTLPRLRAELVDRYVIELRRQRYAMPSLLRDTVVASLPPEARQQAHRVAGDWFGRHFRARQITGPPERLGGAFVEARYHYVQAGDDEALREVGQRFEGHVHALINWVTPVPRDPAEVDERIAFLSALLSDGGGAKGLHYYLARLLAYRRRNDDLRRAVEHARAGTGPRSPADAWGLRIRLEAEAHGAGRIEKTVREAIRNVAAEKGLDALYQAAAEILGRSGNPDDAVALLREGIAKIPTSQPLHQAAAEILDRSGNPDDAVALLREGIAKVPVEKSLGPLYQAAAEILDRSGNPDDAVALLREGIVKVPAEKNLFALYQAAAEILDRSGKPDEAVALLREGIAKIPTSQPLHQAAAEILDRRGNPDDAVALLREGIAKVPAEKSLASLYQAAAEILDRSGKPDEAVALLREGFAKIPTSPPLYQAAAEILDRSGKPDEAVALLREGIVKVPAEKSLFSLYQSLGRILDRRGRTPEAIATLREGIRRIQVSGSGSRYRIVNMALYLAYAANDRGLLLEAPGWTGEECLDPQSKALSELLLAELLGNWAGAADRAARGRAEFPRFLDLAVREAFTRLCAGAPDAAIAALGQFPNLRDTEAGDPLDWLQAMMALSAGDLDSARHYLSAFLAAPVTGDTDDLRALLLRAWDESPCRDEAQPVAYYFPHLPPRLTGLDRTITRRQFGPSALPGPDSQPGRLPLEEVPLIQAADRPLHILTICSEWFSRHGGVPTFNRELCIALRQAGQDVACLVSDSDAEERAHAQSHGVLLIDARREIGMDGKARLYLRPDLPKGFTPDIVIGHDHVTGTAAKVQAEEHCPGARRVHIIHTAPGDIERFKPQTGTTAAAKGEHKELGQEALAETADLVVAVGPRLYDEIATRLHGLTAPPPVLRLDPGISSPKAERTPAPLAICLLLGRTEDRELKGLDIAARAVGLLRGQRPRLIVRGAEPGKGDELRRWLEGCAGSPGTDIQTREYVPNAERLERDLKTASLVLMPSRSEGFGLVGIEALAAGTPILISEQSGLAQLLREHRALEQANRCIVPVTGDCETDAQAWERRIESTLQDRAAAFRNTAAMAAALAERVSWAAAAERLLGMLRTVATSPKT